MKSIGILLAVLLLASAKPGLAQPDSSFAQQFEAASTEDYLLGAIRNAEMEAANGAVREAERNAREAVETAALERDSKFQLAVEALEQSKGFPSFVGTRDAILEPLSITIGTAAARGWVKPQPDTATNARQLLIVLDDTAFCVFQRRLVNPDAAFGARYPQVMAAIRNGRLNRVFIRRVSPLPALSTADTEPSALRPAAAHELWERLEKLESANFIRIAAEAKHAMEYREIVSTWKRDAGFQLMLEQIEVSENLAAAAAKHDQLRRYEDLDFTRERGSYFNSKGSTRESAWVLLIDCPGCAFQSRVDSGSTDIAKLFPRTARAIRSGELGLFYLDHDHRNMVIRASLDYPPFYNPSNIEADKLHALADMYMNFIRNQCEPSGCFDKSLFERYYALEEQKKLTDEVPEQQILARQKFIALLRSIKCKR